MVRDASVKTQDMLVLNEMDLTVFNQESIRSYRQRMRLSRPGHVWEALEDEDFLLKLGAVGIGVDGKKHPTSAGLLMFGNEYDIVREFNAFFLDYQEQYDADTRWTDRIISSSGDWSGNVHDFYFRVYNKLIQDIKVPFKMEGGTRVDDTDVHKVGYEVPFTRLFYKFTQPTPSAEIFEEIKALEDEETILMKELFGNA